MAGLYRHTSTVVASSENRSSSVRSSWQAVLAVALVSTAGCAFRPGCCLDCNDDATCPSDSLILDAPPDAFACTMHDECAQIMPGTCCVNPGPMGYCTPGIIIGGACAPQ